jgi:SAM-dependent methyltransferase
MITLIRKWFKGSASLGDEGELIVDKRHIFDDFWQWFTANAPVEHDRILEIGVGSDGFTAFYAEKCTSYVGLDVDEYRDVYKDVRNAEIITYDGTHFPLDADSFDLAVSHSVFEHILDVSAVLAETWRVLRPGGVAYISINPLYYSSWGSHGTLDDHKTRLQPWEHLDPASPHYLTDCPPQLIDNGQKGCFLNKLTMSEFLAEVGKLPWSIIRLARAYEQGDVPPFLEASPFPKTDLRNHDFRILLQKDRVAFTV